MGQIEHLLRVQPFACGMRRALAAQKRHAVRRNEHMRNAARVERIQQLHHVQPARSCPARERAHERSRPRAEGTIQRDAPFKAACVQRVDAPLGRERRGKQLPHLPAPAAQRQRLDPLICHARGFVLILRNGRGGKHLLRSRQIAVAARKPRGDIRLNPPDFARVRAQRVLVQQIAQRNQRVPCAGHGRIIYVRRGAVHHANAQPRQTAASACSCPRPARP